MAILSTGSQLATQVSFNAGTFDINGNELAALQEITVGIEYSVKEIRGLGTIKMLTAPKRHGFKPTAKAKVKSFNREFLGFMLGSSGVDGTGMDFVTVDGQNVLTRCSIKAIVNDDAAKAVEFQFTNAIVSGNFQAAFKMEDAAEFDFEIEAQDVTVVTNF